MRRINLPAFIVVLLITLGAISCKKSSSSNTGDASYFPLSVGRYVVYNVDSTIWVDTTCQQILHSYQMRYEIVDTFTDSTKNLGYVFNIYSRPADGSGIWQSNDVFKAVHTSLGIEVTQDLLRFVKLTFPITTGSSWQGNQLINTLDSDFTMYKGWQYMYQNVKQGYNNDLVAFDNTVSVIEDDETVNGTVSNKGHVISYRTYYKDVYGANIGMVYSEKTHWVVDSTVSNCKKGYSVIMRAVDHN